MMMQIRVEYADGQTRYFPAKDGWRVDAMKRCLVIGRGVPRTFVPLDGVTHFVIEESDG